MVSTTSYLIAATTGYCGCLFYCYSLPDFLKALLLSSGECARLLAVAVLLVVVTNKQQARERERR